MCVSVPALCGATLRMAIDTKRPSAQNEKKIWVRCTALLTQYEIETGTLFVNIKTMRCHHVKFTPIGRALNIPFRLSSTFSE
jgi:hypothetical protein